MFAFTAEYLYCSVCVQAGSYFCTHNIIDIKKETTRRNADIKGIGKHVK